MTKILFLFGVFCMVKPWLLGRYPACLVHLMGVDIMFHVWNGQWSYIKVICFDWDSPWSRGKYMLCIVQHMGMWWRYSVLFGTACERLQNKNNVMIGTS